MTLGSRDQTRLARILRRARELELSWPHNADRRHRLNLAENHHYQDLKREITTCTQTAESEALRRLSRSALHLHDEISLAHFYAILVPFERLSNRALRDDEFLVEEGDGSKHKASQATSQATSRIPLKLVVENLRSAFNVGALFRTAECLGLAEIWLCGYTPGPDEEKPGRTAMGTSALVPWRRVDRAPTACKELRRQGYTLVALETAAEAISLTQIRFTPTPLAFVIGNERFGLEGETLQAVDSI